MKSIISVLYKLACLKCKENFIYCRHGCSCKIWWLLFRRVYLLVSPDADDINFKFRQTVACFSKLAGSLTVNWESNFRVGTEFSSFSGFQSWLQLMGLLALVFDSIWHILFIEAIVKKILRIKKVTRLEYFHNSISISVSVTNFV